MKLPIIVLTTVLVILGGCSNTSNRPHTMVELESQRIAADGCSYQSAVYAYLGGDTYPITRIYGDASAQCKVIRDGYDELRMLVTIQRFNEEQRVWEVAGPTTVTAKKTLPSGQNSGVISFLHIKAEVDRCIPGDHRVKIDIRSYKNGTLTIRQRTTHLGLNEVVNCIN